MRLIISFLILALVALAPARAADETLLKDNPPDQYVVKKGDTLWDIAGKFLQKPWRWPEIWTLNKEQIKDPHWIYPGDVIVLDRSGAEPRLRLQRGGGGGADGQGGQGGQANASDSGRLSPRVREQAVAAGAIPSIPASAIEPFLSKPLFVAQDSLAKAPHIVATEDNRVIIGAGNTAYVEGMQSDKKRDWQVYRPGKALRDPDTDQIIGYEAVYLGEARVKKFGVPSTIGIVRSKLEINKGDRLVEASNDTFLAYVPHAPEKVIKGRIMSAYNAVSEVAQNSIITVNRGKADGLEVGHVLAAYRYGDWVKSQTDERQRIKLPDERIGLVFVFRVFDKAAYALIMQSTRQFQLGDILQTP